MTTLMVNDHNYHLEITGQGKPIVLLHGFTGSSENWSALRVRLEADFQIIAIDILGHGKSDKPIDINDYQMENVARDVVALFDALRIDKLHLLGYSMGGRLALYIATHYPDMLVSLILESASPGLSTEVERLDRRNRDNALADNIETKGIEWFVDYWEQLPLWASQKSLPAHIKEDLRYNRLQNSTLGLANSLRGMGTGAQPDLWDQLHNLNMPVQLIVGEHDHKFLDINHDIAQKIPQADLKIIPYAGHTTHLENLETYFDTVRQFLAEI